MTNLVETHLSEVQYLRAAEVRPLSRRDQRTLLQLVARSIQRGFDNDKPLRVNPSTSSRHLHQPRACFVTLRIDGALRGCQGSIFASRPLISDIAINALASAFDDERFPPLRRDEFFQLEIQVSVLSPLEAVDFYNEDHLLTQLRPNVDGLFLEFGSFTGVFLPDVWNELPEPEHFLANLKRKAGLTPEFWSDELVVKRFTTQAFGAAVTEFVRRKSWERPAAETQQPKC